MILYNTLMGVCAGLALILVSVLMRKVYRKQAIGAEGWSLTFGALGLILTFLSATMAITWPLNVNPPINILFSEPSLMLGVLLLAASLFLWRRRDIFSALGSGSKVAANEAQTYLGRVLVPISWVLFGLGLVLAACTAAILRFGFVGAAPVEEPISGLLHTHPAIENTFFGALYGLSALGALLAPWGLRRTGLARRLMGWTWITAGMFFLAFSAMNYYTHIGLLVNFQQHTHYRF